MPANHTLYAYSIVPEEFQRIGSRSPIGCNLDLLSHLLPFSTREFNRAVRGLAPATITGLKKARRRIKNSRAAQTQRKAAAEEMNGLRTQLNQLNALIGQ